MNRVRSFEAATLFALMHPESKQGRAYRHNLASLSAVALANGRPGLRGADPALVAEYRAHYTGSPSPKARPAPTPADDVLDGALRAVTLLNLRLRQR